MAVNAQADARVHALGMAPGSVPLTGLDKPESSQRERVVKSQHTNAGDQRRPLPPYLNTLAGDPAKEQA